MRTGMEGFERMIRPPSKYLPEEGIEGEYEGFKGNYKRKMIDNKDGTGTMVALTDTDRGYVIIYSYHDDARVGRRGPFKSYNIALKHYYDCIKRNPK